jgi:hypothetical protein
VEAGLYQYVMKTWKNGFAVSMEVLQVSKETVYLLVSLKSVMDG